MGISGSCFDWSGTAALFVGSFKEFASGFETLPGDLPSPHEAMIFAIKSAKEIK